MNKADDNKMGFWAVMAIGIGGMVGGGIFAVLGLAVQLAHGGTPEAFALGGVVALLTTYSYAKLSVAYPSRGGTVTFLDRVFGAGMITGSLNVMLWMSYVVMLSLYALAFGGYGAAFLPQPWQTFGKHALISLSVILITGLNLGKADLIGKAEDWIVGLKVGILLFFVGAGFWAGIETSRIAPGSWAPPLQMAAGGMIIFLAYEGFELIANTAQDVRDAARTLPRAYVIHRLRDQRHPLRRGAAELLHRTRWRIAGNAGTKGVGGTGGRVVDLRRGFTVQGLPPSIPINPHPSHQHLTDRSGDDGHVTRTDL
jgi:hypothetical protein